jgi:hypothetical protein
MRPSELARRCLSIVEHDEKLREIPPDPRRVEHERHRIQLIGGGAKELDGAGHVTVA